MPFTLAAESLLGLAKSNLKNLLTKDRQFAAGF